MQDLHLTRPVTGTAYFEEKRIHYLEYAEDFTTDTLLEELARQPHLEPLARALSPERRLYILSGKNRELLELGATYIGTYHLLCRGSDGWETEDDEPELLCSEDDDVECTVDFNRQFPILQGHQLMEGSENAFYGNMMFRSQEQGGGPPWWREHPRIPLCVEAGCPSLAQVEFDGDTLQVYNISTDDKKPLFTGLQYCEGRFYGKQGQEIGFVEHEGYKYLFMSNAMKVYVPTMQKIENLKPLTEAWKKRDGRQYYFYDAMPDDAMWGMTTAVCTLKVFPHAEGLMLACLQANPDNGMPFVMPLAVEDDNVSRMFLNASASASRDQFAAEFYDNNGTEEMYLCGMRYRDISYNKQPLEAGDVVTEYGKTQIFAIPQGKKPVIYVPQTGRLLLVDAGLHVVYDSYMGGPVPDAAGGYALFTGQTGARFSVLL